MDIANNERILLPTFRLPTLIHTRSGNAKYLYEISHGHPLWMNPLDADALEFETGNMVRITTDIGYFVMRVWRTEGIRPGVVAASHHLGRWRLSDEAGNERWSSALVDLSRTETGWKMRQKRGIEPFTSDDPDSERIWWQDAGVNQNLAFPFTPTRCLACTAGIRGCGSPRPRSTTATATYLSTPTSPPRSTASGWPRQDQGRDLATCDDRCGWTAP